MVTDNYILKGRKIRMVPYLEWAEWFEKAINRQIDVTCLSDTKVSTVFLGLDHQFEPGLPPILFETMVFGGRLDGCQWRYSTYEQSLTGHRRVVKLLQFLNRFRKPK